MTEYTWDYRNRLTNVKVKNSGGTILKEVSYRYDPLDRRIGVGTDADGARSGPMTWQWTVYNGQNPYADFDNSGSLTYRYLYGDAIDQLFARFSAAGTAAWYLTDQIGSVRDIASPSGSVLDHIKYKSFGEVISESNPSNGDRFKYTSREFDPSTQQYYYRARYYDAAIARFLAEDPLGFDAGDTNFYRYVGNSPTGATDPTGEDIFKVVRGTTYTRPDGKIVLVYNIVFVETNILAMTEVKHTHGHYRIPVDPNEVDKARKEWEPKLLGYQESLNMELLKRGFADMLQDTATNLAIVELTLIGQLGANVYAASYTGPIMKALEASAKGRAASSATTAALPSAAAAGRTIAAEGAGNAAAKAPLASQTQAASTVRGGASSPQAGAALRSKLGGLESAQQNAVVVRTLPDGRIRYYSPETPARTPGPTRGASFVTEWNPQTGGVRQWMEAYDHTGNVLRVHPKTINGEGVSTPHYPPTGNEVGR